MLLCWLDNGANKLKKLVAQMKLTAETITQPNQRGQYFSTRPIGAKPASHMQRKYNAIDKTNKLQHGNGPTKWLKPKNTPDTPTDSDDIEVMHAHLTASPSSVAEDPNAPSSGIEPQPQTVPVTIEEVDDDDLFIPRRTLDSLVEHLLEEDGLADIPDEVFCHLGSTACDGPCPINSPAADDESTSIQAMPSPKPHRPRSIPKAETIDHCVSL
ncbi:hypothetical protein VKT23_007929 [Stygiomarasmius scandens]|uniref:Uncharacterized protein n=1 Tax=Marasmiellus scandens TaxID=2682957 RepID=A0ABR1JLJ0_9AGAR